MSEEELLKAAYKYIEGKHPEECDKYYRKCLGEGKTISVYYYGADEFEGPEFEFEYFGDPSLEVGDVILLETLNGYMKCIIQSIELRYNGSLKGTIKGMCSYVV